MLVNLILLLNVVSASWLVKAPSANPQEFVVYSQNSDYQKISTYFLRCAEKDQILEDFKKAQILFLDGNLDQAKQQFLLVTEKKWSCDWAESERQLVLFSFLRMAQIEQDAARQTQWLTHAVHFDSEWTPDPSVFPPPLIAQFSSVRRQTMTQKIVLPTFSPKYSALLRNGRFMSLAQLSLEATSGKARYTFVSDTYQIETVFMTLTELQQLTLQPQPLVIGDCNNFQLSENLKWIENVSVFFSLNCVKTSQNISQPSSSTNGETVAKASSPLQLPTVPGDPAPSQKTWIQRNGLWLGTALVGSLLLSYHLKNQERPQTVAVPTTTLYQNPGGTD
jgi:hypothetical protein